MRDADAPATTMPDLLGWTGLLLAALIGSTVGGVAGFGAGVIMLPVIAWTIGPKATVPVLTVAMLLGNFFRVWFSRREIRWIVVGAFLAGAVPAALFGAVLYTRLEAEWVGRIIGAFLVAAVPLRRWLTARSVPVRLAHLPPVGLVIGLLSSLVGATGPVTSPFLLGYGLRKGAYLATEALCAIGMHIARGVVFQRYALLTRETLTVGVAIGTAMLVGAYAGRRLVERLSERVFLGVVEGLLILLGAYFVLWPGR